MKYLSDLSKAQTKWVDLIQVYYPEIYARGEINHKELKAAHQFFNDQRKVDARMKIGWPIWLIMNNAVGRAVYQIPRSSAPSNEFTQDDPEDTVEINEEFESFYQEKLKESGLVIMETT